MASKISSDMIRPFTGEGDVVAWIEKVKLVAKLQKIEDLASFLPLYLEGDALAIYLEMGDAGQRNAGKIETRLREAFTDGPFTAYGKLCRLRWSGEQVDVYATEIRRLAGLSGFKGADLERIVKLTFVNGFPDHISMELQQVEDIVSLSMSEVLTRARILAANRDVKVAAASVGVTESKPVVTELGGGAKVSEGRKFRGQCFRCGGPHLMRFCKEKKVIICYRCGTEGHIASQCNRAQGNDQKGAGAPAATLLTE